MTSNAMRYYHQLWINDEKPMTGEYVTHNRPNRHIRKDTQTTNHNKIPPDIPKQSRKHPYHKNKRDTVHSKMKSCISDSSDEQHESTATIPTTKRQKTLCGSHDNDNPKHKQYQWQLYGGTRSMNTEGSRHPEIDGDRVATELQHATTNAMVNPVWPWQHNSCFIDSMLMCMLGVYTMQGSRIASRISRAEWSTINSIAGFSEKDLLDLLCQTGCHPSPDPNTNTTSQYRKFLWKQYLNRTNTPYGINGSVFDTLTCIQPCKLRVPWPLGRHMVHHLSTKIMTSITCMKCSQSSRVEITQRMYLNVQEHWYPNRNDSCQITHVTSLQEGIDRSLWQPKCVSVKEAKCASAACNGQILHHNLRVYIPEVLMLQRQVWDRPWTHGIDNIINIGHAQYKLAGVIFSTRGHFTSAVVLNGQWFGYNDMENKAKLVHIPGGHTHIQQSHSVSGLIHVWLYDRIDNGSSNEVTLLDYVDDEREITSTGTYFHNTG